MTVRPSHGVPYAHGVSVEQAPVTSALPCSHRAEQLEKPRGLRSGCQKKDDSVSFAPVPADAHLRTDRP